MRVLICDDHQLFLSALAETFEAHGHVVVGALPDPHGLAELAEDGQADVCVLDIGLGDHSGPAVAAELREQAPDMRLLLLSGGESPEAWEAYDAGVVDGLVSKACAVTVLEKALLRVLDGERVVEGWSREAPPRRMPPEDELTRREREVLLLIARGATTAQMSAELGVSANTVRTHVQNVLRKLQVSHRTMAVQRAMELGLTG